MSDEIPYADYLSLRRLMMRERISDFSLEEWSAMTPEERRAVGHAQGQAHAAARGS